MALLNNCDVAYYFWQCSRKSFLPHWRCYLWSGKSRFGSTWSSMVTIFNCALIMHLSNYYIALPIVKRCNELWLIWSNSHVNSRFYCFLFDFNCICCTTHWLNGHLLDNHLRFAHFYFQSNMSNLIFSPVMTDQLRACNVQSKNFNIISLVIV